MSKDKTLSNGLREAINKSPLSRYRICKEIGLSESCMSRFMAGKVGLASKNWDAIGKLLGLKIVSTSKTKRKDS